MVKKKKQEAERRLTFDEAVERAGKQLRGRWRGKRGVELLRAWADAGWTAGQVAAVLKLTPATVRAHMTALGIDVHARRPFLDGLVERGYVGAFGVADVDRFFDEHGREPVKEMARLAGGVSPRTVAVHYERYRERVEERHRAKESAVRAGPPDLVAARTARAVMEDYVERAPADG